MDVTSRPVDDPRVRLLGPVCEAVARLLGPHAEVVLHDPQRDAILALWNPISRRRPGDPSLLGELDRVEEVAPGVYGPYEKLLPDGRRLACVSAVVRDEDGKPSAVLCVNLDRTPLDQAAQVLAAFAAPVTPQPQVLFERDWTERINQVIGAFVRERQRPVEQLTRADRLTLLAELDRLGVFSQRRAVPLVARALRVSRSTVYALLAEVRRR
ncbi:hypothetical protein C3Y87_09425 [Carbonactinospora thermoautotrophica]|nr:hypothetical protein [Carbonactinospora thermoautotrophica]